MEVFKVAVLNIKFGPFDVFSRFFSPLWDTTTSQMWLWFSGSMEVVSEGDYCNTKFAFFGHKYLSQDLIVILPNITQLCQVSQRGVGEGGQPSRDRLRTFMNTHPAITRHWPNVVLMLCRRWRRQASIRTTLGQCLVFAGLRSQLISKLESLTQC